MSHLLFRRDERAIGPTLFVLVAMLFYAVDGAILHSSLFLRKPNPLAVAATIDLTAGLTFCYWLLVVRPGRARLRTVLPVFLSSIAIAALVLPDGYRRLLVYPRYLAIPFEIAVVALVVVGIRRTNARLRATLTTLDVPERIRAALEGSVPYRRVAEVIATELSLFWYAFAAWRRKPFLPPGGTLFSYHRRNAYASILWTLFAISLVEMIVVHLALRATAPRVAVVVLALSIFGAVWILGFLRAVQLRPTVVTRDTVHVRSGMQWSLDIPRESIARVDFGRVRVPPKRTPGYLRTVAVGQPNVLLELREPLIARGAYGITRAVSQVSLVLDDWRAFQQALASATHADREPPTLAPSD